MGPYHEGELAVQRRAGVADRAAQVGRIVRPTIPEPARAFASVREFVILGAADEQGRVWATLLQGPPGFLSVPADDRLRIAATPPCDDPLATALDTGRDVGVLAIDPATRRRMRVNGRASTIAPGVIEIVTREVYSNCQKYIHPREVRLPHAPAASAVRGKTLTGNQAAWLASADTLFIASRHPAAGADVSHRGGPAGFVHVAGPNRLLLPDYRGNMMFNTLGNLAAHPEGGILLVDFERGATLQLSGRAVIHWDVDAAEFPGAERLVELDVEAVIERGR
ncbi:MAG TPA: pyridoxamine 5'-phosphate oxidase family protein [Gemmatimonadales bacterium]